MAINAARLQSVLGIHFDSILNELSLPAGIYEKILKISIRTTEESFPQFSLALMNQNRDAIAEIVHDYKGVFANLRITPLSLIGGQMMRLVSSGAPLSELSDLLDTFKEKFAALKTAIE
ncbi:MAG: Hpt domain-containing protein [Candidatus Omnitrophica bacterium]|nr:Hpt domain-containing protein [Candidatus Omnitrophota bacterium]